MQTNRRLNLKPIQDGGLSAQAFVNSYNPFMVDSRKNSFIDFSYLWSLSMTNFFVIHWIMFRYWVGRDFSHWDFTKAVKMNKLDILIPYSLNCVPTVKTGRILKLFGVSISLSHTAITHNFIFRANNYLMPARIAPFL